MLRTKLFRGFALIVLLFSVLSILVGARTIKRHMVAEAQTRARLDLSSAWAVYNAKMEEIATVLRLAATKEVVVQACAARDWANEEVRIRLEKIRAGFGLDFLDIVAPEGKVVARMAPPYATGDVKVSDRAVSRALRGEAFSCMAVEV
jgi:C4-dicarboxylate-specific signal transduction histidine kinase